MFCNDCGNIFQMKPTHLLSGHGCSKCSTSKGEKLIHNILKDNNILFEDQKKFNGCVNKKPLSFDFYLPNNNIVIEYNGIQHYKPVDIFGGEKQFKKQIKNDKIKKDFCKANNIQYMEISYKYYKNIKQIINEILLKEVS